jgi:3-deoxy-D-manno-octulosonic acid (KDO) 8-phosphate synthase
LEIARECKRVCDKYGFDYYFKASFDKANRTNINRMDKDGNDYPLKKVIDKDLGFCYNIKDYKETWKILQDEFSI